MIRAILLLPLVVACTARPPTPTVVAPAPVTPDQHIPDYARRPFEPFGRANAVAIAQREWRAFGSIVNDDPPGTPPRYPRPDLQPGLWQRVGDFWWFGMDAATKEGGWTGRYNEYGTPYLGEPPAWSAAFVSYVMRAAGAGTGFPYSPLHADYINAAARNEGVLHAERPEGYAPQVGDLICLGRGNARSLTFDDLPTTRFFAHCDIVTSAVPGQLEVIGGNVVGGVTLRHVPTTLDGRIQDPRYPWFVVLRVAYEG